MRTIYRIIHPDQDVTEVGEPMTMMKNPAPTP